MKVYVGFYVRVHGPGLRSEAYAPIVAFRTAEQATAWRDEILGPPTRGYVELDLISPSPQSVPLDGELLPTSGLAV